MTINDIPEQDIKWAAEPVIGVVLMNAEVTSAGEPIHPMDFYTIGKHLPTGKLIIIFKHHGETKQSLIDSMLNGQLN